MSVAMDPGFLLSTLKCVHVLYPVVVFHSGFRRVSRPGSARPAPPRVKRQDSVEVLTADR